MAAMSVAPGGGRDDGAGGAGGATQWRWRALLPSLGLIFAATALAWSQSPGPVKGASSWWDWLRYPIERNAAERLPIINAELTDIAALPDGRMIVVGDGGTVLTSDDGGESWDNRSAAVRRLLVETDEISNVAMTSDGHAILGTSTGQILTSSNWGANWAPSRHMASGRLILALEDGGHAVAVGRGGNVMTSDDFGRSWSRPQLQVYASAPLEAVAINRDGKAVVVGRQGTSMTSRNYGRSWTPVAIPIEGYVADVALTDDGQVLAIDAGGTVARSMDFGTDWAVVRIQPGDGGPNFFSSVSLLADGTAIIANGDGATWRSSDFGSNWHKSSPIPGDFVRLQWAGNDSLYAVGGSGGVWRSDDVGETWNPLSKAAAQPMLDTVLLADGTTAAVGAGGLLFTSDNFGQDWETSRPHPSDHLLSVAGYLPSGGGAHLMVGGANGVTWRRADALSGETRNLLGNLGRLVAPAYWLRGIGERRARCREMAFVSSNTNYSNPNVICLANDNIFVQQKNRDWRMPYATPPLDSETMLGVAGNSTGNVIAVGVSGTILHSADSGNNWRKAAEFRPDDLGAIAVTDSNIAFAVGEDGSIASSLDGGQNWRKQKTRTRTSFLDVAATDKAAIIVGWDGTILSSRDRGATWQRRQASDPALRSISLSNVALEPRGHAIASGDAGLVLLSDDFGATWHRPVYARYPAPWYWLAILLAAVVMWIASRGKAESPERGAQAMAASDAPTTTAEDDRLDFLPLARGISRFLRNKSTKPPLTLAITGDWGSGKSSLMSLVCGDMRRYGWRPVWFNAWHHQKEEQLLPALLDALRTDGLPPALSWAGIAFRLRLLWLRSRKHYLLALLAVFCIAAAGTWMATHRDPEDWQGLLAMLGSLFTEDSKPRWEALSHLLPLLAFVPPALAIKRALAAFGMDPAVLLTSSLQQAKVRDLSVQAGFRTQFAREFKEVVQCLDHWPVIVIDDLDRCQPETVLDIMEAVNFLTSSGDCFILFGMARERVQASLAMSFKDIARELAEFDLPQGDDGISETAERDRRQRYARDYLEKLVNIEVVVPDRKDIPAWRLLVEGDEDSDDGTAVAKQQVPTLSDRLVGWWRGSRHILLLAGLGLAVLAGYEASHLLPDVVPEPVVAGTPAPEAGPTPIDRPSVDPVPDGPVKPPPPPTTGPAFVSGAGGLPSPGWVALALALLGALGGLLWLQRLKQRDAVVEDTKTFKQAMRIWAPVVAQNRSSPRSIKRFGNRIRYLAMLQQGEVLDTIPLADRVVAAVKAWSAVLWAKIRRRAVAESEPAKVERELALAEHRVVALGALHACFGEKWQVQLRGEGASPELQSNIAAAITAYETLTDSVWPPSDVEQTAFMRSLKGVRVAGEAQPIAPDRRSTGATSPTPDAPKRPKSENKPSPAGPAKKGVSPTRRPARKGDDFDVAE